MNNYIIIGDSITYGIGDLETSGWASMFKQHIIKKDNLRPCTNLVHIAGFPGATSKDILAKLDNIIEAFEDDWFKNIVILSIGVNDTQYFNGDFEAIKEEYIETIRKIINKITARGFKLVVLGLTRIEIDDLDLKIVLNNDEALEKLCAEEKIKYIPLKDALQSEDYVDGVHPSTVGHRKIFEIVKEQIEE